MTSVPETERPEDFGAERQLRRAWAAARALHEARRLKEAETAHAALEQALARESGLRRGLEAENARLRHLLGNKLHPEALARASDLSGLNAELARLEGRLAGARKTVQIPLSGPKGALGSFLILGRLCHEQEGRAAEAREALICFRFLDASGQGLEPPSWLRQSDIYGSYRYISPDPGGWFERAVSLPEEAAWLELTVHDFRASLYKNDPLRTAGELRLSDLCALPDDILDWSMLAATPAGDQPEPRHPGPLLLGPEGVQSALTLPMPVKAVQFEIALGLETLTASRLEVVLRARSHDGEIRHSESLALDGSRAELTLGLHSPSPFSQLILELRCPEPGDSLLLLERSIRRVGSYPDPGLFGMLNAEEVAPAALRTLAEDWQARGKWFCVEEDLTDYEAPLVLVRRCEPEEAPLMLNLGFEAEMDAAYDRRGMVCSLLYYDASGRRIAFQDPEFALSPAVANYRYVPVENRPGNFLCRLPRPEPGDGPPPAYMALCMQGWNRKRYRHISARPMLAPADRFAMALTQRMLHPESEDAHDWHGVFARLGAGWRRLLPDSWQSACGAADPEEIMIRLGGDESRSPWRDIGGLLWSPETKKLRAILGFARRRAIPLRLHLEALPEGAELPRLLLPLADHLHVTQAQAPRLSGLLKPGARVEITRAPAAEAGPEVETQERSENGAPGARPEPGSGSGAEPAPDPGRQPAADSNQSDQSDQSPGGAP